MTAETPLPPYLPYPRFLVGMDLTQTAKLLYALLLDRATLSQKNGWIDETGRLYLVFPIGKIANAIDKSPMTVKNSLNELDAAGLIERRRQGFSAPNHIYVKLPDGQEIIQLMDRKLSPNNLSNNNKSISDQSRAREAPAAYGRYQNVFLTEAAYQELQREIPGLDSLIEQLSSYMQSSGKQYADHAVTLRRWAQREKPKQGIPDYSYKEGESL